MEAENYLKQILKNEKITDDSSEIKNLQSERKKVEKLITDYFKNKPVIRYAGSYKKDTMIKSSYDLDIVCYFKHDDNSAGDNLKEIYENEKKSLEKNYIVKEKKSALHLMGNNNMDFNIDVVPGRFVDDSQEDAFLYQSTGEKNRLKTNLGKHISHIRDSQLTDTIKLIKLWRSIHVIDVKTFALELLVIKTLDKNRDSNGLAKCFTNFMEIISQSVDNIAIEDPANSGNDLSDIFNGSVKSALLSEAKKTLILIRSNRWEDIFGNESSKEQNKDTPKIPPIVPGPPSPPRPPRNREVGKKI